MRQPADWPVLDPLDRRLNAHSADLADIRLQGQVNAVKFVAGRPARIKSFLADLKTTPTHDSSLDAQVLHGEAIHIFDQQRDWLWLQSDRDGYVGWTQVENAAFDMAAPTHWVTVPRTFIYPDADMKLPRKAYRGMGSGVCIVGEAETRGTKFYRLDTGGAMIACHLMPVTEFSGDYVSVAEQLIYTPYLWGGKTSFGLDCSGLVQLAMRMAGIEVLADSDMQAATIGEIIDPGENWQELQRGDLVFWRGHVGICQGEISGQKFMIHANGHTMNVVSEPLTTAIERIANLYQMPIGARRPIKLGA